MAKLSVVQLTSVPDVAQNLASITNILLSADLQTDEDHLVVLPECCLFFGGGDSQQLTLAKDTSSSKRLISDLANIAKQFNIYLVAGSIPLLTDANPNKFTNSCCVFTPDGQMISQYDKIHLFDVTVEDNSGSYLESRFTQAGDKVVTTQLPFATLGLTICYDLRFPELFRALTKLGAQIITVPAAFTQVTGKAHWQSLLQARAIENQVYIVAAGQSGEHQNGRQTWGHSMIISPWGQILAELPEGEGLVSANFSLDEINKVRASIPVAAHNKFKTELMI